MRINSIKGTLSIKCRAVIWATTAFGGTNLKQPVQLLSEVKEIYGLSGIN